MLASDPRMERSFLPPLPDPGDAQGWSARRPDLACEAEALRSQAPTLRRHALIHGDPVRANVIPTPTQVWLIDWETLSLGDPMWDLAILLAGDRQWNPAAAMQARAHYAELAPVDDAALDWHLRRWRLFWSIRESAAAPRPLP